MRARSYVILGFSSVLALSTGLTISACEGQKEWIDPDTIKDAGLDYALAPQVTHFGPDKVTCCMETLGTSALFYLADPMPAGFDRRGNPRPPQGQLHLATPYGVDYTLGEAVPAYGYGFSPDGKTAFYLQAVSDGTFSLNALRITLPDVTAPMPKVVIKSGLEDDPLSSQAFYTPTANYLIVGARAPGVESTGDVHVVSVLGAEDLFTLPNGAWSYYQLVNSSDVMFFQNDTASRTPGVRSVEGLYMLPLQSLIQGAQPVLVDEHTAYPSLTADESTLIYLKLNGELKLWDLRDQDRATLATDVVNFSIGPQRRGPIVWVQRDLSLHVAKQQQPEIVTLPPNAVDLQSPIYFSPDRQHLYFYKNMFVVSDFGDLYHVTLPPWGDGKPNLVSVRASTRDLTFTNEKLLFIKNVSNSGDTGDLVVADLDGSHQVTMAPGTATGDLHIAYPKPYEPPPGQKGGFYPNAAPPDMTVVPIPPVLANLVNATRDNSANLRFVNGSRPVVGALAYAPELGKPGYVLNPKVHVGQYQFSDDGYLLLYVGDAQYLPTAFNYVGSLGLFQTNNNVGPVNPMLDGVAEIGPIVDRTFFVSAPGATPKGMYFVKY